MKKKLFLIDDTALIYRAYFAFIRNPLITSKGENTSAPFGFTNSIMQVIKQYKPDYLAIAFDTAAPTFRKKMYEDYKANREKMPDELVAQLPRIDEIVEAFNIPILRQDGYEADDLIGTLAKKGEVQGLEVYLVTGDKDFYQLINDNVKVMIPPRHGKEVQIIEEEGVIEKFGVPPEQVIEVMGLMGDTSDNIPGVPKVGPKTATKLIVEYGTLENTLENAANVKGKVGQNLIDFADQARLSKQLVTIETEAPIDLELEKFIVGEWDHQRLLKLFKEMEFNRLIKELTELDKFEKIEDKVLEFGFFKKSEPQKEYNLVDTPEKFESFLVKLSKASEFAYDTETTDVDPMKAKLVGFSFSFKEKEAYYLPVGHAMGQNLSIDLVCQKLKPIMADQSTTKIAQNMKYDNMVLSKYDIDVKGKFFDTMIASFLLDPATHQHNLDILSLTHLNHKMIPIKDLIGTGKKQISFASVSIKEAGEYSCEDADVTYRLYKIFHPKIKEQNLESLFYDVEIPLIAVLQRMEKNGVRVDANFLNNLSNEFEHDLIGLTKEIYGLADEEFNINSPQQLAYIMFEKLGLPPVRKTSTGKFSTDVNVLEKLAKKHELPKKILDYRQFSKLKSTYVDALQHLILPETQRVHTSFNQTVASTGRLSSTNPNLQNIPIRTEVGRKIRKAFVPAHDDWFLLSADYSQVELRVMAHISGDPNLSEAFLKDEDVHTRTAALVFGVDPAEVDPDMRRQAKIVNFGVMYGMGEWKFSQDLGVSMSEAREFIEHYYNTYSGIKEYKEEIIAKGEKDGYVTTILGRRRPVPDLHASNGRLRNFAEHVAINTPIQGSAADIIKIAMIDIHREMEKLKLHSMMILQVHDELLFDVPPEEVELMKRLVKERMEGAIKLDVPLKVDVGIGKNWLEAH